MNHETSDQFNNLLALLRSAGQLLETVKFVTPMKTYEGYDLMIKVLSRQTLNAEINLRDLIPVLEADTKGSRYPNPLDLSYRESVALENLLGDLSNLTGALSFFCDTEFQATRSLLFALQGHYSYIGKHLVHLRKTLDREGQEKETRAKAHVPGADFP